MKVLPIIVKRISGSSAIQLLLRIFSAVEVVRATLSLVHRSFGVNQANTGTWTTPANATGANDGTFATCNGATLAATHTLNLDYVDMVGKTSMTRDAVRAHFYSRVTGDLTGLLCDVSYERSLDNGGSWSLLGLVEGNHDNTVTPRTFTLSPVPSWAQIDAIRYRVSVAFSAASLGVTFDLDAVQLEVNASQTVST